MNSKILRLIYVPIMLAGVILVASFLLQRPAPAQALPPRPTAVPTAVPIITGAGIQLTVEGAVGNEWTMVQWQHPFTGEWHDISGWQGRLNEDMGQQWWVGSEHFGRGPYRWQVYEQEINSLVAVSDSFTMPERSGQILQIHVTVP